MTSEEHSEDVFLRFVSTIDKEGAPKFVLLTGGEPMLRPQLVKSIAEKAHSIGVQVIVGSGFFFATSRRMSIEIRAALDAVDHITISIDAFHEKEVPRQDVFRVAKALIDRGKDISFQIVGFDQSDPYLRDITDAIQTAFGENVPAYVGRIGPKGRARDLLGITEDVREARGGCIGASWPVVAYDGTIVPCCNQDIVNGPRPDHLVLGHAATDSWLAIKRKVLESFALRAIRAYGPRAIASEQGLSKCGGYCSTCFRLSHEQDLVAIAERMISWPETSTIEKLRNNSSLDLTDLSLPGYDGWPARGLSSGSLTWSVA